jgi:pimeloyl-ACP methyl ester carboxylesterase
MLFLHGGLCDHRHFAPQFEYFRREHRVVAPDLRGHGQSDKPEQDYTIGSLADDVAWLCTELGLYEPVVVGHSMGGIVALDLAFRYPELPAAIVMLDAPVLIPPALGEALNLDGFLKALRTPAYRDAVRGFIRSSMLPTDDSERSARILDQMASAPQYVVASSFESGFTYDAARAAASLKVPTLYVRAAVPADLDRFRALCPHLVTGQTVGSGHFHQLEVSDQVNAMIDRFLTTALPVPARPEKATA